MYRSDTGYRLVLHNVQGLENGLCAPFSESLQRLSANFTPMQQNSFARLKQMTLLHLLNTSVQLPVDSRSLQVCVPLCLVNVIAVCLNMCDVHRLDYSSSEPDLGLHTS